MGCGYSREIREGSGPGDSRDQCCDELPPPSKATTVLSPAVDGASLNRKMAHDREESLSANRSREPSQNRNDDGSDDQGVGALLVSASHHRDSLSTLPSASSRENLKDGVVAREYGFPEDAVAEPIKVEA